ncbi:unnamed protein product [Parascedosporium putredinis]|uniref:CST complex subunit Stn1 N-terminal domain-containing protein n=1 Tax=Parascedosporium putredinis TaxID=1442378 RepID=A0A9P1HAK9_9PEZI|nr:unnamed protein product [Parascedosporium putredinis]CAI8004694.1 unnamed protein product [Parascedosporium putredinis]
MANKQTNPSIYPQYCFKEAPTHEAWCFLRVADIPHLRHYPAFPDLHFYKNLPIKFVRVVGVIVAIDDYAERRVYTVDDSSGVNIECVLMLKTGKRAAKKDSSILGPRPPIPSEFSHLAVGCVVDVKGTITHYHRSRGLKIARAHLLPSTESELLLWEKRRAFRVTVLDRPWVLSEPEILRCRQEAERADAELAASKRKGRKRSKPGIEADPFKIIKEKAPTKRVRQAEGGVASRSVSNKVPAKEVPSEVKEMKRGGETLDPLEEAVANDPYSLVGKTNAPKTRAAKPHIPITCDPNADEVRGSSIASRLVQEQVFPLLPGHRPSWMLPHTGPSGAPGGNSRLAHKRSAQTKQTSPCCLEVAELAMTPAFPISPERKIPKVYDGRPIQDYETDSISPTDQTR